MSNLTFPATESGVEQGEIIRCDTIITVPLPSSRKEVTYQFLVKPLYMLIMVITLKSL
jgi:hypothetical protein